jgi:hypothetical protein
LTILTEAISKVRFPHSILRPDGSRSLRRTHAVRPLYRCGKVFRGCFGQMDSTRDRAYRHTRILQRAAGRKHWTENRGSEHGFRITVWGEAEPSNQVALLPPTSITGGAKFASIF